MAPISCWLFPKLNNELIVCNTPGEARLAGGRPSRCRQVPPSRKPSVQLFRLFVLVVIVIERLTLWGGEGSVAGFVGMFLLFVAPANIKNIFVSIAVFHVLRSAVTFRPEFILNLLEHTLVHD